MRGGWHRLALLSLFGLASCGGSPPIVSLGPPRSAPRYQDYDDLLGRWTRKAQIIKKLDTTLRVNATLFSPEFNAVYVAQRTQMFKLPDDERRKLATELAEQWSRSYVFLVAAATIDFNWNDFNQKRSVWRVSLANDQGDQLDATEIERQHENATLKALFPFIGRFHRAYIFRFPKLLPDGRALTDGSHQLVLRFAGPLGQADLVWRLR